MNRHLSCKFVGQVNPSKSGPLHVLHRSPHLKKVNKVDKFWGGSHVTCLLLFLLSISTASSRPSLSSSDFYSLFLFIYFSLVSLSLHILWLHLRTSDDLFWRYIMVSCEHTSGDLFCTHTSTSWHNLFIKTFSWLIQYINLFMLNFFSISTTSLSLSLYIRDIFGLICLLRKEIPCVQNKTCKLKITK